MLNDADASGFKKVYLAMGFTDLRRGIDGLAGIIRFQFVNGGPSFRSGRYQFIVVMPNRNYDVHQDFEENELMSELERTRMQIILHYLDTNKEINSSIAAKLLKVEIKTAGRLLSKAAKLDILNSYGKTKNKIYFRK